MNTHYALKKYNSFQGKCCFVIFCNHGGVKIGSSLYCNLCTYMHAKYFFSFWPQRLLHKNTVEYVNKCLDFLI